MKSAWFGAFLFLLAGCGSSETVLVAAGTTLVDSGFIEAVADDFVAQTGIDVDVLGEATAQVLALGRSGSVDVTITHSPDLEAEFEADGLASLSETVFTSRFVIAGPPDVRLSAGDAAAAFREIAALGGPFVGRQDGSGTALVEAEIWAAAGIDGPSSDWYLSTGQGMGLTLQVASERTAFVLAELGTFLSTERLDLVDSGVRDPMLENPYRAMSVAASESAGAVTFVEWLASGDGHAAIQRANLETFGTEVFVPATGASR
jgi:tungstate transport system substrate-binding protein